MRRFPFGMLLLAVVATRCSTAAAAPFAYVSDFDTPSATGAVAVIDLASDTVIGTIALPNAHAGRVALNPLGTRLYVAHADVAINAVSAVDATAQTYAGSVAGVGHVPTDVVVNASGTRAYVTLRYDDAVAVIDTATDAVIDTIPLGSGASPGQPIYLPMHAALSPDGTRLYVTNHWGFFVSIIDTASDTVVGTIPVGQYPVGVAFAPSGARAYVANFSDGSVSVIATATGTVVDVVHFPQGDAIDVTVAPAGDRVFVTSRDVGRVQVIDTATDTLLAPVAVGATPNGLAMDPSGARLYVANFDDDTVSVIDTATYAVTTITGVGNEPVAIAVQNATCQSSLAPLLQQLADTAADLADAQTQLAAAVADADADGVRDGADACAGTAVGAAVDALGCSQQQFCGGIATADAAGRRACKKADWKNDEPAMRGADADCAVDRAAVDRGHACVPRTP